MLYREQYIKKAHKEVDTIFYSVLPAKGLKVRQNSSDCAMKCWMLFRKDRSACVMQV